LFGVNQQQYADDTRLFIALSPNKNSSEHSNLESAMQSLSTWFSLNGSVLNPSKSESDLFGTKQRPHNYVDVQSVSVAESVIPLADDIKILGTTLRKNLSTDKHVNRLIITHVCYDTSVDR
jgi:hypothetical protein